MFTYTTPTDGYKADVRAAFARLHGKACPTDTKFYESFERKHQPAWNNPLVLRPDNPYEEIPVSLAHILYPTESVDPETNTIRTWRNDEDIQWYRDGVLHDPPSGWPASLRWSDENNGRVYSHYMNGQLMTNEDITARSRVNAGDDRLAKDFYIASDGHMRDDRDPEIEYSSNRMRRVPTPLNP